MLAQSTSDAVSGALLVTFVVAFVALTYVLAAIPYFAIFTKAGQPGWAGFVPIYNWVILMRVIGRPDWWVVLLLIPVVNIVVFVVAMVELAASFGKGGGFAVGLVLLSWVFLLILGFGSATYLGPSAARVSGAPRPDVVPPPPPR
jgi:uncharacterized protein DUF5684